MSTSKTVSKTIVDALVAQGVTQVFGVVGDALNSFTDAIRITDGIDWIGVRHEEVAAFAAGAQAQLSGTIGVCAGTVGPGSIHLLNGLYDSAKSHAPVLAITGQVPLSEMGSQFFQEVDNDALFQDVAVFNRTITSVQQVPQLIEQAIAAAIGRSGVAVLSLPGDIGATETDKDTTPVRVFANPSRSRPDDELVAEAARMINDAASVTILAGIGSRSARHQVIELADRIGAPMVVTLKAKEIYDWDNPFQVGQNGLLGNPSAATAFDACDLLLMIGTDFPYRSWYPDDTVTLQIDAVADHIGRRTGVDLGLVGDAELTLEALLPRIRPRTDRTHLESIRDEYDQWNERQQRLTQPGYDDTLLGKAQSAADNQDHRIRPEVVAAAVNELADDAAIFTTDTGMSTVWFARFVHMREHQRLIGSFNLGSMANAMPQAIGAQAKHPDRQVIAFSGDGGFTMLLGDLLTAVTHRLPIKIIVFDNHRLGMVKLEQEEAGLPEFGTTLDNPDIAAVALAMGAASVRITDPAEVRDGLSKAFTTPGPVVIDILTNPSEVALPPQPSPGQAWGFAIAKIKETIRSRGDH